MHSVLRPPEKSSGKCRDHNWTLESSKLFSAKGSTILDTCPGAEVGFQLDVREPRSGQHRAADGRWCRRLALTRPLSLQDENHKALVEVLSALTLLRGGTRHNIFVPKEAGFMCQKVPTRFSILGRK
jgi:hypothetical protein